MMNLWELMSHPRKDILLLRPPSAKIFLIEAGSDCLIGSILPTSGLNIRKITMTTNMADLANILHLQGDYNTSVTPSLIWPSTLPLYCGSILMSASSALLNAMSPFNICGVGSSFVYGESRHLGPTRCSG